MTRPEKPVDWERVDQMLMHGSLGTEIANVFDMHPETFYRKVQQEFKIGFTEYCAKKRSKGDYSIREAQFKKAVNKLDNTMLIWLGKQRLGQRETHSDIAIPEDLAKPFLELMAQFKASQESSKRVNTNNSE